MMNETQSRFMQNIQNVKPKIGASGGMNPASGGGVFQNNFLLPKASPNAGMLKTFYNSKQSTSGSSQNTTANGNLNGMGQPQFNGNIYSHGHHQSTISGGGSNKRGIIHGLKMQL